MNPQSEYNKILERKLSQIKTLKDLEVQDKSVESVMTLCRNLYKRGLDTYHGDELIRIGGELQGFYVSLGVTTAHKRAERDSHETSYDELLSLMTTFNKDTETGITEARNIAKTQCAESRDKAIIAEYEYRAYEAVLDSCRSTISFIQSALKQLQEEKYKSKIGQV
jgi:hypothetical protein